ncbi:MAG: twin-arginine translocase subunit TatC, partial [Bacteroidales bacterium]|nr:twin-arginine translocase subunit TatC [Bacteroidales bacterium]
VVLPVCLMFFMNYTVSPDIINTITLGSYISTFTSMVFLIGIVFEFPAVAMVLSKLGVIDRGVLRKYRRHAFIAILVLSALITPSDPFSMVVLAIPMYGLYEFSIILCKRESNE